MNIALIVLELIALVALIVLVLRRSTAAEEVADPRLAQLLSADLPGQITRLHALMDARSEGLNQHLRGELSGLRTDSAAASTALRTEVLGNINTLGNNLRLALEASRSDAARQATEGREALHARLNELGVAQSAHQDRLHATLQKSLDTLTQSNEKKLEDMRQTVDEKLHTTLQTRLTESFGQVTDQLTKVHAGLGEMTKVSEGMDSLSRIFSNVRSRGTIGEVLLGSLLEQMLAPTQYVRNAQVKPNTNERVEFAIRFPGADGDVLLPIDSKFPRESGERLESAYESNDSRSIDAARKSFDTAIRTEGKRICAKYINEPTTTPNAIMFLPSESLYAEVMRRDGLQSEIQQNYHVTIAGPSNLCSILTSFQMIFQLINLQKKGGEVWKVLGAAKTEFGKFGDLMKTMGTQVGTVQNTIQKLQTRTNQINKTLGDVTGEPEVQIPTLGAPGAFDGFLPMLAASDDE